MREAHEAAVLRSKQNRQIEDVALLKAQHRAKRVEAQTARRRRERAAERFDVGGCDGAAKHGAPGTYCAFPKS